ncbi:MAG: XylR family transcriptional regulator, partial [Planctomycetota bacterium]
MRHTPHVALIIETSSVYGRQLLRGISDYMKSHHPWSVFLNQRDLFALPPKWLSSWDGDGVICRSRTTEAAQVLKGSRAPVVDVSDIDAVGDMPRIESDNIKIGQMAAEHLRRRGFHQFAFCGFKGHTWSLDRQKGFESVVHAAGYECAVHESAWERGAQKGWEAEQKKLTQWLEQLPRPVGVMACNDMRGQQVLDACARAGIAVPESAAVIGCDNDEIYCNLCTPPLSSVIPNPVR